MVLVSVIDNLQSTTKQNVVVVISDYGTGRNTW